MRERLQKIIAASGTCSRRKAEELIIQGKVTVNNVTAKIGESADPENDKIAINGKPIRKEKKIYLLLNKPKGIVCTMRRQGKQKIITDIIKTKERIFPAGRLDKDTTGILILTNDGGLANYLTHPSKKVWKTYEATLDKPLKERDKNKIKKINICGRKVEVKNITTKQKKTTLQIHEGRKHIVKRIFEKIGYKVKELKRTAINKLKIDIREGKYRKMTKEDLKKLGYTLKNA
ncbi:rRNA pseudouridine synthase [Candidatus Woesearchaeota archaeon]|nr:MAG: rRNA pseudouridine synthase [Candidatus Woesearchaeota archaeon]